MPDLDKIIKGWGCCRNGSCFSCPYNDDIDEKGECKQGWGDDAFALLKAQKPRLITLEEIEHETWPMWYEERNGLTTWALCTNATVGDALEVTSFEFFENYDNSYLREDADTYNICWRMWTAQPTQEQMEATPWQS